MPKQIRLFFFRRKVSVRIFLKETYWPFEKWVVVVASRLVVMNGFFIRHTSNTYSMQNFMGEMTCSFH